MEQDYKKILAQYDYILPATLIAQKPVKPREAARLLVYNRKSRRITHDTFRNLGKYLPPKSLIIFNDTKVIPARLHAYKDTGGKIQIFFLNKTNNAIQAFLSPALAIGKHAYVTKKIFLEVVSQKEKIFTLKPSFPISRLDSILARYGTTPLPPYIKHCPLSKSQTREQYQTVFAKINGSVAAPTASLHFTKRLLRQLKAQGHQIAFITLHVNLGTFAPLEEQQLINNKLHEEWFYIPEKTKKLIQKAKQESRQVIACGTTVVRALESAVGSRLKILDLRFKNTWRKTDLFIKPPYKFKIVNGLITNFHLPKSSLLMLVAAFTGRKEVLRIYKEAIKEKHRFYSFGDGMLIV